MLKDVFSFMIIFLFSYYSLNKLFNLIVKFRVDKTAPTWKVKIKNYAFDFGISIAMVLLAIVTSILYII